MTEADLRRIETELSVALPASYRRLMSPFPIPACAGNDDTELWDDADALIERNRELRAGAPGGVRPWPQHLFLIGDGGSGCAHAIDLRTPHGAVWWVDHGHLDIESTYEVEASFAEWAAAYVRDLRADLEGDGVAPDGTPQERERVEAANARDGCMALLVVVVVLAAAVAGIAALTAWWR